MLVGKPHPPHPCDGHFFVRLSCERWYKRSAELNSAHSFCRKVEKNLTSFAKNSRPGERGEQLFTAQNACDQGHTKVIHRMFTRHTFSVLCVDFLLTFPDGFPTLRAVL